MRPKPSALQRGVDHLQRGELQAARQQFQRAAIANTKDPVAVNCLGIVARAERRTAEALKHFQRAIALKPEFAEAILNLGNTLRDLDRLDEAEQHYQRAVTLKPDSPEAHNSLGVSYLSRGATRDAIRCFEEAIRLNPLYPEAHNNLGNAMSEAGDDLAALASFTTALQLRPNSPEIHNNLANAYSRTGQQEFAHRHCEHAIQLKPDFAQAYLSLGNIFVERELATEAITAYQRAATLADKPVTALINLGNAYRIIEDTGAARDAYLRVASLEPGELWHQLRLASLCPAVFRSREEMHEYRVRAMDQWSQLADEGCKRGGWRQSSPWVEPSLNWQFLDGNLRPLKETYARLFADSFDSAPLPPRSGMPRIGIVVTRGHEGLFLRSMRGVLEHLPASGYDLLIACPRASESSVRRGLSRNMSILTLPERFDQAACALREAAFDCLYYWEIGTDPANYFLPRMRLAPVQCTSWGIQVTSGMETVDYYLSSEHVEPGEAQDHYTEKLLLSRSLLSYQYRPSLQGPRRDRGHFGLGEDQHLYVCAQQLKKFHPDFDERLAGILRQDTQGVVVAVSDRYEQGMRRLRQRFAHTIPDVAHRVIFLPHLPYADYVNLIRMADVVLDPPHFGGVNSTYDSLALEQPIVTLPSAFHRGRYTAACYQRMGVTECIAASQEDYVRIAVAIATQPDLADSIRRKIRDTNDVLFHDQEAVHEHERLFQYLISVSREERK